MDDEAKIYLIPSLLDEEAPGCLPFYIIDVIMECDVMFVENERSARRFLKKMMQGVVIDKYEWFNMTDETKAANSFREKIKEGKTIGIISEAGCPGIADPGQQLVAIAQQLNIEVKPLVGPNSILLALMASGMNGQQFRFNGYLPIKDHERKKTITDLETESAKKNCTQIFIETPYRNNQLIDAILGTCQPSTRICIAVDLTGKNEFIKTKRVSDWKKHKPDIHKRPAIFLLHASS